MDHTVGFLKRPKNGQQALKGISVKFQKFDLLNEGQGHGRSDRV